MQPFNYKKARQAENAVALVALDAEASYLADGTSYDLAEYHVPVNASTCIVNASVCI